jgi:hypothetical protein
LETIIQPPTIGPPNSPPPSSGGRLKWIPIAVTCGAGCGILFILAILAIILTVRGAKSSFKEADQTARQFIQCVAERRDEKAYALTSTAWHKSSSLKDLKSFADIWRQHQGVLKSATLKGIRWYSSTEGTQIILTYDIQGSMSSGQVTMVLVAERDHLRVQACNYSTHSPTGK